VSDVIESPEDSGCWEGPGEEEDEGEGGDGVPKDKVHLSVLVLSITLLVLGWADTNIPSAH